MEVYLLVTYKAAKKQYRFKVRGLKVEYLYQIPLHIGDQIKIANLGSLNVKEKYVSQKGKKRSAIISCGIVPEKNFRERELGINKEIHFPALPIEINHLL